MSAHVEDRLAAYSDGALDEAEARQILGHLEACQHCRSAYREVRDGRRAAEALAIVPMPDDRADAVRAELRAAFARPARRSPWRWALPAAASIALLALGGLAALRPTAPGPVLRRTVAASPFEATARGLHVALASGAAALDSATDSPAEARRWLEERAGVSASLAELRAASDGDRYRLSGVRLVELDGSGGASAGAFHYRIAGRPVTLVVARESDVPDAPKWSLASKDVDVRRDAATGLTTLTWSNSGNAYALVSDLPDAGRESCFVCHAGQERRRQILLAPIRE